MPTAIAPSRGRWVFRPVAAKYLHPQVAEHVKRLELFGFHCFPERRLHQSVVLTVWRKTTLILQRAGRLEVEAFLLGLDLRPFVESEVHAVSVRKTS